MCCLVYTMSKIEMMGLDSGKSTPSKTQGNVCHPFLKSDCLFTFSMTMTWVHMLLRQGSVGVSVVMRRPEMPGSAAKEQFTTITYTVQESVAEGETEEGTRAADEV